jgi:hypothetical protein
MISFITHDIREVHMYFQTMVLLEWLQNETHTGDDLSYVTVCGQTMHDSRVRVCSTSRSHTWPRVNPNALRERVYQVHFSVSFGLE